MRADLRHVLCCLAFYLLSSLVLLALDATAQDASPHHASQAVQSLKVAEDLEVALFAAEPMLVNPTNMDIDAHGRVWVIEGYNYRPSLNQNNPTRDAGDRIVILEDTDGDGTADKHKVFYQGNDINAALGIAVLGNKVIVSAYENIFIFTDTDGDDTPDTQEVFFTGIGGAQHDHSVHAFVFGPDGKLYFNFGNVGQQIRDAQGTLVVDEAGNEVMDQGTPYRQGMVFRLNPDGSAFEVLAHNFRNNYEVAVDAYGTLWQSDNDDDGNRGVRINYVMEFGNYGYQDEMTGASWRERRTGMHEEIPLRHWHLNDPGVVPNLLQTGAGSPTGITVYEGRLLPRVFWDQMIHADAGPNVVRAYPVTPKGAGYEAGIVNIVEADRDPWFRPSDVTIAPDGSLFIADWYDPGVGGHQVGDLERGRVFRVAPPGTPYRVPPMDLSTPESAIEVLKSPNMARRYLAWQTLHAWQHEAEPALRAVYENIAAENPRHRARALWLLTKIDGRGAYWVDNALEDANPNLRIVGLRAARQLGLKTIPYVRRLTSDPSAQVRREVAIALRHDPSPEAAALWAELALQHDGHDRWYLEALGIAADRQWDRFFDAWLQRVGSAWNTPAGRDIVWRARAEAAVPLLAALIVDASTDSTERLRYFRAFDFHTDPAKNDVLATLIEETPPEQTPIRLLALNHISPEKVHASPTLQSALHDALTSARGTQVYLDLVRRFGLHDQSETLLEMAMHAPDADMRVEAARLLYEVGSGDALVRMASSTDAQEAVRAVELLGHVGQEQATTLLHTIIMDPDHPLAVRRAAVAAYGRGWGGEDRLLEMVRAGQLPEALKAAAASTLSNSYREHIRTEVTTLLDMPQAENNPLPPIPVLVAHEGDGAHGQQVFTQQCSACHQVNGQGIAFGPDLSEIGSKLSREGLYTSILHPDAGISFGYEGYVVTLTDGSEAVGYIASETPDALVLRTPGGISTTYKKADIASRTPLDHSLMPSTFNQSLSEDQLVDLIEFLSTLKREE